MAISTRTLRAVLCERRPVQQTHRASAVTWICAALLGVFESKRTMLHRKSLTAHCVRRFGLSSHRIANDPSARAMSNACGERNVVHIWLNQDIGRSCCKKWHDPAVKVSQARKSCIETRDNKPLHASKPQLVPPPGAPSPGARFNVLE